MSDMVMETHPSKAHRRSLFMGLMLLFCVLGMLGIGSAIYASIPKTVTGSWVERVWAKPRPKAALVAPESFRFKADVAADDAEKLNAAIPESSEPIISALPFASASGLSNLTAIDCLTAAIHYEAATETITGQRAVAQVVLNRVRHPAYPNSVCGVVFQGSERRTGCQFSFTCDGSLSRRPSGGAWIRARTIAAMALAGYVEPSVGLATHYHTVWVVPYWSDNLTKIRTIGAHIFYRWNGNSGKRSAFTNRYADQETPPATLAAVLPGMLLTNEAALPQDELSTPLPPVIGADNPGVPDGDAGKAMGSTGSMRAAPASPLPERRKPLADERVGTLRVDAKPEKSEAKALLPER